MAGLVLRTPRLELRWPSEDDLVALAELAARGIHDDNPASLAVTRKLGYAPNGETVLAVEGKARRSLAFVLTHDRWAPTRRSDIELVGLAPCLPHFGAGSDGTES